jgi:cytochrome P450
MAGPTDGYENKIPSDAREIFDLTVFNPFSYGAANCVGRNLALLEMRAITCFIVQKFKFEAKDGVGMEF